MAHIQLMLSHFHIINQPDPGFVDDTYYLENVNLDLSAAMSILEFPYSLSKFSWLYLYNVIANILSPLILGLQLTMFLFLATYHLQLSDLF